MTNNTFQFYSVLKNEDANPYIGANLLAAADGLGGSGSAVHAIDREKHIDMHGEIISSAFGDMKVISPELMQYMEELIAPMIDGKDDTSALWASRVVIARCVYALTEGEFKDADLSDQNVREKLTEYIGVGLHEIAQKFNLKKGRYDGQLLLPTTLAFMRYTEKEDSVVVETLWAGDSRCYALTPDGLKLLSVDDEDNSGTITNLFYADNKKTKLNYMRHELAKPCALLAVSDGIFDPFDPHENLGVEHTLLSAIQDHDTLQEVATALYEFYENVHGDDATMAFVAFGFDGLEDMQKKLAKRTDEILAVRQKQGEFHDALEVMNQTEEDASHYVFSRTNDRFDYIASILVDALESNSTDIAFTPEVKKIAKSVKEDSKKAAEKARREKEKQAMVNLYDHVKTHPELVSSIFVSDRKMKFTMDDDISSAYADLWNNSDKYKKIIEKIEEKKEKEKELMVEKDALHERILERINFYYEHFISLWEDKTSNSSAREDARRNFQNWISSDFNLQYDRSPIYINSFPTKEEQYLAKDVQRNISRCYAIKKQMREMKENGDCLCNDFITAWETVFHYLKKNLSLIESFLTPEAVHQFGFDALDETHFAELGKDNRIRIISELKAQKTAIVSSIVTSLAEHYDKESVIDKQYNATKLELFRTYFRLKTSGVDEVKVLEEKLNALEKEYTSLVRK